MPAPLGNHRPRLGRPGRQPRAARRAVHRTARVGHRRRGRGRAERAAGVQVPRILNPVALVVDALPDLCREPKLNAYVCSLYGSAEGARCAPRALAPAARPHVGRRR